MRNEQLATYIIDCTFQSQHLKFYQRLSVILTVATKQTRMNITTLYTVAMLQYLKQHLIVQWPPKKLI